MAEAGYLDKLNDNQRAAVEFGVARDAVAPPLLVRQHLFGVETWALLSQGRGDEEMIMRSNR